jgi:hypothetical protein
VVITPIVKLQLVKQRNIVALFVMFTVPLIASVYQQSEVEADLLRGVGELIIEVVMAVLVTAETGVVESLMKL